MTAFLPSTIGISEGKPGNDVRRWFSLKSISLRPRATSLAHCPDSDHAGLRRRTQTLSYVTFRSRPELGEHQGSEPPGPGTEYPIVNMLFDFVLFSLTSSLLPQRHHGIDV